MAKGEAGRRRACCMISEILEESGMDREKVRQLRRQVLEGIILLCRWQLERMGRAETASAPSSRRARKVTVE